MIRLDDRSTSLLMKAVILGVSLALSLTACGRLNGTQASSGKGSDPGTSAAGSPRDPDAPGKPNPRKLPLDCGAFGDTGPDTAVSYTVCPGDDEPAEPKPQVVTPRPDMADLYPISWQGAHVGDDDRTVTIDFTSGIEPCYVLDHVDVGYGRDSVTITLFEGHDPEAEDVACIEIGVFKSVVVTLDEPLAGRTLVDGAAQN